MSNYKERLTKEWVEVRIQNRIDNAKFYAIVHLQEYLDGVDAPYDPMKNCCNRQYGYKSQCQGKMKYDSYRDARPQYQRLVAKTGRRFKIYKCGYCGFWHIGRTDKTPEEKNGIKYNIW